ncbi:MAG: 3-methyl-2-oxobutanoate hydroxymethyltransferase [Bdellovibrionota bacterium]
MPPAFGCSKSREGANRIVAITAYDYTFARLIDELVDLVLVGDSLGMVIQGKSNTLSVKIEDMVYHTRAVREAVEHAHVVADMPFMTYQSSFEDAVRNAGRLMADGGAEAVKLEGGVSIAPIVERLVEVGIPVLGHVGLTPQSVNAYGGYKVQGKTEKAQQAILQDALALEDAGAYAVVLEAIPAVLGKEITDRLKIPTIGIGAGPDCDGQVLVSQDLLGLNPEFQPRFVKAYAQLGQMVRSAVSDYATEVRGGRFPDSEHSFS